MTLSTEDRESLELLARCTSFPEFLRELVWVKDTVTGRGILRWEWWPVHERMCEDILNHPRLVVLKARQISWSWFLAAFCVWSCYYTDYFQVLVLSKGEDEAKEFLEKCRFIWEHLPDRLRISLDVNNTTTMEFSVRHSKIMALPSTEAGGVGYTFGLIVVDEAAFHPYGAKNFLAYSPAASETGAQIVVVSTADGMGGFFHSMYQSGKQGLSSVVSRFYGWTSRPGRTLAWREEQRLLAVAAGEADKFYENYPDNDIEAFLISGRPRFDKEGMAAGLLGCRKPLAVARWPEAMQRIDGLQVWELPIPGEAYVAGCDTAQGLESGDADCTQVLHAKTLRHVACLHGRWEPDVFGAWTADLTAFYNNALLGIELTGWHGGTVMQVARTKRARLFYHNRDRTRRQEIKGEQAAAKPGWLTTGETKGPMIDTLASRIATGTLVSWDPEFWGECRTYVRDKAGGTNASGGNHDDRVMAMAIAISLAMEPGATLTRGPVLTLERTETLGNRYSWNHRRSS